MKILRQSNLYILYVFFGLLGKQRSIGRALELKVSISFSIFVKIALKIDQSSFSRIDGHKCLSLTRADDDDEVVRGSQALRRIMMCLYTHVNSHLKIFTKLP